MKKIDKSQPVIEGVPLEMVVAILNASEELVCIVDTDNRILLTNHAYAEFHGDAPEKMVGQTAGVAGFMDVVKTERVDALERDDPGKVEVFWKVKKNSDVDLEERYFSSRTVPCAGQGIEGYSYIYFLLDRTAQIKAESNLLLSERRLFESQRITKIGSWELDHATNELYWSDQVFSLSGTDKKKYSPKYESFLTGVHPEDIEKVDAAYQFSVINKLPYEIEHRMISSDGSVKHVREMGETIYDQAGDPVRSFGTVQDITEQVVANQEKEQLEMQLQQSQRLETIGTLAGGIAHDFNNILTPISGYASLLKKLVSGDAEAMKYVESISGGAARAADLVKQILLFSKQVDQVKVPVSIGDIVTEASRLLRSSMSSSVRIGVQVDESCAHVLGDSSQIYQVVLNLCTNSWQAMQGGEGAIDIVVRDACQEDLNRHSLEGEFVLLSVSDTGSGMSRELIDCIFEPFFSTKESNEGTGLGLSVVHGIVERHGGKIEVLSEPGTGSTFNVLLPSSEMSEETGSPIREILGGVESVLVLDDDLFITELLSSMLGSLGYKVSVFNAAENALQAVEESPDEFDLLITDYTMPVMNGVEVALEVARKSPGTPVLIMTGYSDGLPSLQKLRERNIEVLSKPLTLVQVSESVRRILDKIPTEVA